MDPAAPMRLILLAALMTAVVPAYAWYQVEVIVFEYLRPNADGELFAEDAGPPDTEGAVELSDHGMSGTQPGPFAAYRVVPPSRYRLGGVQGSLRSSPDYRPLLHVAWEQPGSGEGPSRYVRLQRPNEPGVDGAPAVHEAGDLPAHAPVLDGTVRVRSGRLLFVDMDIAYLPEAGALDPGSAAAGPVRIRASRKLKLNELHYLDHPLFGVLIEVSRLRADLPAAEAGDQTEEGPAEEVPED